MDWFTHISLPTLLFIIFSSIFKIEFTLIHLMIIMFFALLPDLDFIYAILTSKKYDDNFQHHNWISHWPVTYLPLLAAVLFFPKLSVIIACLGIFSQMIKYPFLAGDGIMWFYPFSKQFINFYAKDLNGHHGKDWFRIYRRKKIFKVNVAAFTILIVLIGFRI